jgi:hypothetical protein
MALINPEIEKSGLLADPVLFVDAVAATSTVRLRCSSMGFHLPNSRAVARVGVDMA